MSTSPDGRPLELLKVAELRDKLKRKNLSLQGAKKELFERLEEAIKAEGEGIVLGEQGVLEGVHQPSTTDGTGDVGEDGNETKDKASMAHNITNSCPGDQLPSLCPNHVSPKTDGATPISDTHADTHALSDACASAGVSGFKEDTEHPLTDEATPTSEKHALPGVSAPAGVAGFDEDREQHSAAIVASVGSNNDVPFVHNAVCENGDGMVLPEKVPGIPDVLGPGKESSGNHETRPEIATADLKASENVHVALGSGDVSDVIKTSIENGNALVAVGNAMNLTKGFGTECVMQDYEEANLLAGPELLTHQLSNSETSIEVCHSETKGIARMQPTLDSGLPVVKSHEVEEVGDLKVESLIVASPIAFEPLADAKSEELKKRKGDDRDMIVNDKKLHVKMVTEIVDAGLEEKGEKKSHVKMEQMEVDAGLVVISEGNKEMHIDKEDSSQLKHYSEESQLKEVKAVKSSHDHAGESRVPGYGKSNVRDNADMKHVKDDSQVCINSKRKDTDLKQHESVKRVRRWNFGKEMAADAPKPLATDTAKEIILLEHTEGSQSITRKAVATSRDVPLKPQVEPDSGNMQTVPPSARAASNSLKIERFIRPFTLKAVKDLLAEYGQCVDFWMDQIKTHCFVTYSSVNEAVAARNGLYGRRWPPTVGNFLVAEFVDSNEVKVRSEGLAEKAQAAPPTVPLQHASAPVPPLYHYYSSTLPPSHFSRESQFPPIPKRDLEPAGLTLEDLFFKTKAEPSIYYLPLTDKQVSEKLAAVRTKQATSTRR